MPDPKLARLPIAEMPDFIRDMASRSTALRGDATFFEVGANAPEALQWYIEQFYGQMFYSGRLPRDIVELCRYKLSTLHGCKFCNQGNRVAALEAGMTKDQLLAIDDPTAEVFTPKQQAALKLADRLALTSVPASMPDDLYQDLSAHFDDGQVFELGLILSMLSGIAKFLFTYDLVEKEDYCAL